MLPGFFMIIDNRWRHKCGKNISDTLSCTSCASSLFLPNFDVICDFLLDKRRATCKLFHKMTQTFQALWPNYLMDIKTSYIRFYTFWTRSRGSSYPTTSASTTATITEFLLLKVSFACTPKNVYFLSTVYVTVISQGLHSQLVMCNEGILKNETEFLIKTGWKEDFYWN